MVASHPSRSKTPSTEVPQRFHTFSILSYGLCCIEVSFKILKNINYETCQRLQIPVETLHWCGTSDPTDVELHEYHANPVRVYRSILKQHRESILKMVIFESKKNHQRTYNL